MGDKFEILADAGWRMCFEGRVAEYMGKPCTGNKIVEPAETPAAAPAPAPKDTVQIDTKTKAEELRRVLKPKE